jgi:hypothetical protein
MDRKLLLLLLAVTCASCAPVDTPDDQLSLPTPSATAAPPPLPLDLESRARDEAHLKERIENAIEQVRHRDLLLSNGFWAVFHGILGLGPEATLKHPLLGVRVKAIDYICEGGQLRGMHFIPYPDGVDVETGEMFVSQGHQDQFIAEMAQCGMPADRKFLVEGKEHPFLDFVHHSQMRASVTANQELSWTILVLGQYLGTDLAWTNSKGEALRFEDLVRYEINAPIMDAACGGTHRLFGLKWVANLHARKGGTQSGVWKDLEEEQVKYQQLARKYQNLDGSFSTSFFREPASAPDLQLRMNTTGHILEWLAYSLPQSELHAQWIKDAVYELTRMFLEIESKPMETGTLYHALHGLRIYHERVFGSEGLGSNKAFLVLPPGEGQQSR